MFTDFAAMLDPGLVRNRNEDVRVSSAQCANGDVTPAEPRLLVAVDQRPQRLGSRFVDRARCGD